MIAVHLSKTRYFRFLSAFIVILGLSYIIEFPSRNTRSNSFSSAEAYQNELQAKHKLEQNETPSLADRPERKEHLKFIHITKNGGTTIEDIGQAFGLDWGKYHKEYGWRHKPFVTKEPELIEKYDWFMVVRNPFDRLISEFHCTWGGVNDRVDSFDSIKFNWFIREKIRAPEEMQIGTFGSHYVPQYRYLTKELTNPPLGINGKSYNPILRFEHLAEDFDALMEARGLAPRFSNQTTNQQSNHKKVFSSLDFDSETVDLILEVYDEDFTRFGYSRNPKDSVYASEIDRTPPVSTKKAEDYKIFIRTPENISLQGMIKCFRQRHLGSSIFKDNGKYILQEGKPFRFIHEYFPQVLVDVYLWRISRRWQTTTNLAEADIVFLLNFPIISKYAGDCEGTTHENRQKSVIDWASENLPDKAIGAIVCPSFKGCDGNEINNKLGSNVKILMKERNPKWLLSYTDREEGRYETPPIFSKMVNDPKKTIMIPYTAHRNLKRWRSRLLEVSDDEPYDAPRRCNITDTYAPWCDGSGRGKHKWKKRKNVLFLGDILRDAVREAIGKVEERADMTVASTSLHPNKTNKGHRSAVNSYAFQMMQARFCLVPRGDSPTSRRLFDSIVAGCLPIVISDDIDRSLPFSDIIPYDAFWFRVEESDWIRDPNAVMDSIVSTPEIDIGKRLRIMETYVPLLDWTDAAHESGFRRVIEELVIADDHQINRSYEKDNR